MFTSILFPLSFFAALVAAAPGAAYPATKTVTVNAKPTAATVSQCNTSGVAQCCNSVQNSDSEQVSNILSLLNIVLDAPTQVGLTCTDILGGSCNQTPVCCENNNFNGLINVGCVPITL